MARGVNTKANGIDFRANRFDEFLKLIPQNLTDAEKAQVLENIGAIGEDDTLMTINGTGVKKGDAVTTAETAIVVDGEMSESSTNAPQNKVVKSYVDAADKALQDQIGNVPADYVDLPYTLSAGYIKAADGTEGESTSNHMTNYIDISSLRKIKFLGIKVKTTTYTSGFAFYDENKDCLSGFSHGWVIDTDMAESVVQHEYVADVPANAKYFRTTLRDAQVTESDFYVKGQDNLTHIVGTKAEKEYVDSENVSLDIKSIARDYEEETVDVLDAAIRRNYSFSGTNYATGTNYKHIIKYVEPGAYVRIKANSTNSAGLAFVTNADRPSSGGTIPLCAGTSVVQVSAGKEKVFKAPEDAIGVIVYIGAVDTWPYAPESMSIYHTNIIAPKTIVASRYYINAQYEDVRYAPAGKMFAFRIKFGKQYVVRFKGTNDNHDTVYYGYATGLPVESLALSSTGNTYTTTDEVNLSVRVASNETLKFFILAQVDGAIDPDSVEIIEVDRGFISTDSDAFASIASKVSSNRKISEKVIGDLYNFTEVNLNSLTKRNFSLNASGLYGYNTSNKHVLIPVSSSNVIKVTANSTSSANLAFLTSDSAPSAYGSAELVDDGFRFSVSAGKTAYLFPPDDANYLLINLGTASAYSYKPAFVGISSVSMEIPEILQLNPDSEFSQKIKALRKYNHNDDSKIRPVMFAHMSDIHGGGSNTFESVKRFLEFVNHHSGFADMVQTGDLVIGEYTDAITNYTALIGSSSIINVIGNHDTNEYDTAGGWRQHVGVEAYNRYIKDNVAGWGVTQPANAETLGKCYFYKDYSQSSTAVLRAIFLDIMGFDSDEKTWLEETLASAKTAGLPVVIFTHFVDDQFTSFKTNYSSLFGVGTTRSSLLAYNPNLSDYPVSSAVDAFQQDGGVFAGYIIGHYHRDMVAHLNQYPQQMVYSVSSNGGASELRDWEKVAGNRNIDDFQLLSVDTYAKEVKLCKVGANIDYYCREKSMCSVDYKYYDAFSESDAYSVGDKVFHDGKVYKFIADHSAGAWDASEVEEWDRIISNH